MASPPILWDIESDPILANVKLIAEAWDAAGLYQVGSFVGDSWKEWNGRFRDDVRAFLKGDNGMVRPVAYRLIGSPDLYAHKEREPEESINFIACHDGLTLNDLVSYDGKHNEENGEDNRDGTDNNLSWNCGVEGPTQDLTVEKLRNRQVKNFLTLTLLAVGTPMLLMGDEMRRTQRGNNNAYCQNNETSWLEWKLLFRHADIHRFAKQLIFRSHSRPNHVTKPVHVLTSFNAQANRIRKRLVYKALSNIAHGIYGLALTCQQTLDQRRGVPFERQPQVRQHLGRKSLCYCLTDVRMPRRVVGQ